MSPSDRAGNPYQFRRPITDPQFLIGRKEELALIRRCLDGSEPVHIALIGERASGKTTLLYEIRRIARDLDWVPVALDLDESVVSSPFTFFKAVFEGVIAQMVADELIARDDPRYESWLKQVYAADTSVRPADQLILYGMLAASAAHGAVHPDVSPSLLKADTQTLAQIAMEKGKRGIVLLLDEGDLIGMRPPLIEKIRNLLQADDHWMLVAAGTELMFSTWTEVFSPIPRQFVRVHVGPFEQLLDVLEAIRAPLAASRKKLPRRLELEPVFDIWAVTGGSPYEINLVCYYIWEAIQSDEQQDFELSTSVLDNVLAELSELGREIATGEIEAIRRLEASDFETAVEVIPYEGLSVEQLALTRLLPRDFEADQLASEIRAVQKAVDDLSVVGILDVEEDRFHLRGGSFVRVYFKYAAASLHTQEHRRHISAFGDSYRELALRELQKQLHTDVFGEDARHGIFAQRTVSRELGHVSVGRWLPNFQDAVDRQDIIDLVRAWLGSGGSLAARQTKERAERAQTEGLGFVGFALSIDLDRVEVAELVYNSKGLTTQELSSRLSEWAEANRAVFEKYRITIDDSYCGVLDPSTSSEFLILAEADLAPGDAYRLFVRGEIEEARSILENTMDLVLRLGDRASGLDWAEGSPRLVGDLCNNLGFVAAALGDLDRAEELVRKARTLSDNDLWLRHYNLAYIQASRGDTDSAIDLLVEAEETLQRDEAFRHAVVLGYFPAPPEWHPQQGGWNALDLTREGLLDYIPVQRNVLRSIRGDLSRDEFLTVYPVATVRSLAVHRLLGWAMMRLGDTESAKEHFRRAAEISREAVPEAEYEFVTGVMKGQEIVTSGQDGEGG